MDVCSDGHEEIVFAGRYCPICDMLTEHNKEIEELKDKIEELKEGV